MPQNETTAHMRRLGIFWHRRLNIGGYHIALQFGRIYGVAIWPRGSWPKAPILYWWWSA